MPCTDGVNADDIGNEKTTEHSHNHNEDEDDACPITCFCTCCGTPITYLFETTTSINIHTKISTVVLFHYQTNYNYSVNAKIWQPPQIFS